MKGGFKKFADYFDVLMVVYVVSGLDPDSKLAQEPGG